MSKKLLIFLLAFTVLMGAGTAIHAEGIMDKVKQSAGNEGGLTELEKKVDESGGRVAKSVRNVGITVSVLLFIWIGYTLWGAGGNPQALMAAKGRVIFFFLGLFCVFGAEWIVGTFLGFIGFVE